MTLFSLYIFNLSVTLLLCVYRSKVEFKLKYMIYFIYLFSFVTLARQFPLTPDLKNYADYGRQALFLIREPFFLLLLTWSNQYLEFFNPFFLPDLIASLILTISFYSLRLPLYGSLSFISFFPVILGFNNNYRQFFATLVLLLVFAIYRSNKGKIKLLLGNILAIFTHNAAAVFVLLNSLLLRYRYLSLALAVSLGFFSAVFFNYFQKANAPSGLRLDFAYLFLFLLFAYGFSLRKEFQKMQWFILLYVGFSVSWVIFELTTPSERLSLSLLILIFPTIIQFLEISRPRLFVRLAFSTSSFLIILPTPAVKVLYGTLV